LAVAAQAGCASRSSGAVRVEVIRARTLVIEDENRTSRVFLSAESTWPPPGGWTWPEFSFRDETGSWSLILGVRETSYAAVSLGAFAGGGPFFNVVADERGTTLRLSRRSTLDSEFVLAILDGEDDPGAGYMLMEKPDTNLGVSLAVEKDTSGRMEVLGPKFHRLFRAPR